MSKLPECLTYYLNKKVSNIENLDYSKEGEESLYFSLKSLRFYQENYVKDSLCVLTEEDKVKRMTKDEIIAALLVRAMYIDSSYCTKVGYRVFQKTLSEYLELPDEVFQSVLEIEVKGGAH